jgi:ubiquinone/menaquinone biosynthesis C-methylase UbiE
MPDRLDTYTHGHHQSVVTQHAKRTAGEAARFLLPHLAPGMRVLDVGCGPGSITVGLAEAVAPGEVVGIDLSEDVLDQARALAAEKGLTNLRFEKGDIFQLDQPDASFDAAYAHQVLQHLHDPVGALREMRRLVRRGGCVGVRDSDYSAFRWDPPDERLDAWVALYHQVTRHNKAEADAGRFLYGWMRQAGFEDVRMSGSVWTFPGYDTPEAWGNSWAERALNSQFGATAVESGLATRERLEWIAEGFREWAANPDAFFLIVHVEALGIA